MNNTYPMTAVDVPKNIALYRKHLAEIEAKKKKVLECFRGKSPYIN